MQLRYNFRLYPTPGQQMALAKAFGCVRVVFNDGLRAREQARAEGQPYIKDAELSRRLTQAKATPERAWLSEVSAVVLQQALADLNIAYRNFFNSLSGKRKGRKIRAPRYRSRRDTRQAIRFTANARFKLLSNGRLRLPRVGDVAVRWSRQLPAEPSSVTVIRDSMGRFFASFVVDVSHKPLAETDSETGIDLGLAVYATDHRGRVIANPRFLRNHERRLRKAQKVLCRKHKGSQNRDRARHRVARLHAKVADCRRDWLHRETTRLIRENQVIYLEDLAVAGLARTRLAKSVHDASWGAFRRMLEQKAERYGRTVHVIGRFEPTTKRCSACGTVRNEMPLSMRVFECEYCGHLADRDVNAARNILAAGQAERQNACGARVRPGSFRAPRREAGTHPTPHHTARHAGIPSVQGGEDAKVSSAAVTAAALS